MAKIRRCRECGIPRHVSKQVVWRDNGTAYQRRNPDHRSVFIESENIDGVFRGIEFIIGTSIEHIVVESRRRSAYDYLEHMMSERVRTLVNKIGIRPIFRQVAKIGRALGYGDVELMEVRRKYQEGDHLTVRIRDPYSIPLFCGDVEAALEIFDGREVGITYEEVSPDVYDVTAHFTTHPMELVERLAWREYTYKEGDVGFVRCPRCGVPEESQQFEYNLDKGIIIAMPGGRRMVGIGPAALEAVFEELERELGETIPQVVIDAQRRFVAAGFYSRKELASGVDYRKQFALRGLGNLREMEFDDEHLFVRLENACLHLMLVGLLQGFFELVNRRKSEVEWELTADDVLTVEVAPKA
jgi:hypothetical protein